MEKKINTLDNGSIFSTYKIVEINSIELPNKHPGRKLFVKIDENDNGITLMPMLNSINYNSKNKYKEYIKEIKPDETNRLRNLSYINCASNAVFINKSDCKNINEIGTLSKEDLIEVQEKIIHALCNNIKFEQVEIKFSEDEKIQVTPVSSKRKVKL